MSIGYEVKLTPLQILNLYNAVANDGRMMKPRLVKELRHRGEVIKSYEPEVLNPSICSKETLGKLRMMLEGVVDHGTAKNLKNPLYQIAGKTGTAQVANLKYGYTVEGGKSYQASFVGYFPADKPKYSCIVVVNAPSNEVYYGNLVAGPIFKEIADKVYATSLEIHEPLNLLEKMAQNIPVSMNGKRSDLELLCNELSIPVKKAAVPADWVITRKQTNEIAIENRVFNSHQVPNVVGMGLRDALFLLENNGLSVKVVGKGTVKSQSLPAGTDIDNNSTIIIELS
jgi:cell division protein FtsI (penicillin-binding protein 3)